MRRVLPHLTLIALFLAVPLARAGVYDLAQKRSFATRNEDRDVRKQLEELSPSAFLADVGALRSMNDGAPTAQEGKPTLDRQLLLDKTKKLEEKREPLTTEEAINLSAYYLRLGRADKARALLEKTRDNLVDKDPYKFLVLLNLAAAYETTPEFLRRAIETEAEGLAAWPKECKDWSADDLAWYRVAEGRYLLYLKARLAEGNRTGNPPIAPVFPGATFDEPGRDYQAGSFGPATADALPLDAHLVVAQLLLWLPNDARLYWLYGEILNGRGYLKEAKGVLFDVVENRQLRAARPHYLVLADAPEPQSQAAVPPTLPPAPEILALDWRQIAGSFLAGAVVAALGLLQWRQWSQRNG